MLLLFLIFAVTSAMRLHRVAITQAKPHSTRWAVAHHVYFLYDSIDQLPDWEPYLVVSNWTKTSIHAFGRTYRTTNMYNLSAFTVGIASAQHASFPAHMTSIAHIQGAEYMNMDTYIRGNLTYPFEVGRRYDAMWLLPHHAWQGPFLAERNRIQHIRECPYVWSPRILEHRGLYTYKVNQSRNVGVYETNVGLYKTAYVPLLILNKLAREHPGLMAHWEAHGLLPISTVEFKNFVISLNDALAHSFNISKKMVEIPAHFDRHNIGTVLSHQFTVGLNNVYFEALYMNMAWVHNSQFFKDCGYYYEGFDIASGSRALERAIREHDTHLQDYAKKASACVERHSTLLPSNILAFKRLLDEWIPPSPIVKAAKEMRQPLINVMYAINMAPMVRSWLCNTKDMSDVQEQTLLIVDAVSYRALKDLPSRVTFVVDEVNMGSYLPYGTYGYWQLVQRRLHIFGDLLRNGQDIFIIEPDAWWEQNPMKVIDTIEADVVGFENSNHVFGFGFLRLRSSAVLQRIWSETEWIVDTAMGESQPPSSSFVLSAEAHEQIVFSNLLQTSNLTVYTLDDCHFPSGKWYASVEYRTRCPSPHVIQNNYVVGFEQKKVRAKRWGHWFETCWSEPWSVPYATQTIAALPNHRTTPLYNISLFHLIGAGPVDFLRRGLLDYVSQHGWTTKRHKSYPTTDVPVKKTPLWTEISSIVATKVFHLIETRYGIPVDYLVLKDLFFVKYDAATPGAQKQLQWHRDGSAISFVILMNDPSEFTDGHTQFFSGQPVRHQSKGDTLLFSGRLMHGAAIRTGKRYILAGFVYVRAPYLNQTVVNRTKHSRRNKSVDYDAITNLLADPIPIPSLHKVAMPPRILWSYWDSDTLPDIVNACVNTWRRVLPPEWSIRVLSKHSIHQYLHAGDDYPQSIWTELVQHQADMFRAALLNRYGGVWLDATTILRANMLDSFRERAIDWIGYGIEQNPEIFAMATSAGSPTIREWHSRMLKVLSIHENRSAFLKNTFNISEAYLFPQKLLNASRRQLMDTKYTAYSVLVQLRKLYALEKKHIRTKREFMDIVLNETSQIPLQLRVQHLIKINYVDVDVGKAVPGSWWHQLTQPSSSQSSSKLIHGRIQLAEKTYTYVGHLSCSKWLAGILTTSERAAQRQWMRKSIPMPHVFLVGSRDNDVHAAVAMAQALESEMNTHQDIIVFGVREQYNSSLTQKVQGFFQVVLQHCPETQYVLKTDDDVWFNTTEIRPQVESLPSPVYYGRVLRNQSVQRNSASKYADPEFPEDTYPPYVSGWGYVLDRAAVQKVVAQKSSRIRPMEDVHTGMLLQEVTPVHSEAFYGNVGPTATLRSSPAVGGIGNRLFFWASAMGLAAKRNLTYCASPYGPRLDKIFQLPAIEACSDAHIRQMIYRKSHAYEIRDLDVRSVHGNAIESIQLMGYFQSFKYFGSWTAPPFSEAIQNAVSLIFEHRVPKAEHYVGIHVRRGDILTNGDRRFPPTEYFVQAMDHYRDLLGHDITFVVASDDRAWCRQQSFFNDVHILHDSYPDGLDMALLANCNHTILSIGTFGWWSAWLAGGHAVYYADEFDNTHPGVTGKVVPEDYYPPHWTPLRPSFSPSPGVTLTLCVPVLGQDIDRGYLDRLMRSVEIQTRAPDEIILAISDVDPNTCAQTRAKYPSARVTCSVERRSAAASRNLAWSLATQEFVSFMDADDYMFPNRMRQLAAHTGNASILLHQFGDAPGPLHAVLRGDAWPNITRLFGLTRHPDDTLAHGHVTVRRDVPIRQHDQHGEDVWFVHDVLVHTGPSRLVYIQQPLTWYVSRQNQTRDSSLVDANGQIYIPNTTLITAYFPIKSKHSHSQYIDWMRHLCSVFDPLVIITTPNMTSWFRKCRQERPTVFLKITLEELKRGAQQSAIKYGVDNPLLYHVWNKKVHWLKKFADLNPFLSSHFLWIDAGYFRNILYDNSTVFQHFPFVEDKIFAMNITRVSVCPMCVGLSGGLFGGTRRAIGPWHDLYYDIVHNATVPIIQEQTHMYETCQADASQCRLVYPLMDTNGDPWFSLVRYFTHNIDEPLTTDYK